MLQIASRFLSESFCGGGDGMMSGHLYLVGFMGAGKSTIGPILRDRLEREFVDLDEKIVAEAGVPIHQIFNESGEHYFRDLESRLLLRISR